MTQTAPRRIETMAATGQTATLICANCASAGIFTKHPMHYGNIECHTCRAEHPNYIAAIPFEPSGARRRRALALLCPNAPELREFAGHKVPSAATDRRAQSAATSAVPVTTDTKTVNPRCAHYAAIRGFYASARDAGLNLSANERMRQALSCLLNRNIESRREMSERDWNRAAVAVSCGELIW